VGQSPEARKLIDEENKRRLAAAGDDPKKKQQVSPIRELFIGVNPKGPPFTHPDTGLKLKPKFLGGPEADVPSGEDPRVALFDWMRKPDNPFFARSFVNR